MLLDPELQQAIAEAYACAPQDVLILHTLEINHKTFNRPARVARWSGVGPEVEVFRCRLEGNALYNPGEVVEFVGLPFELVPPENPRPRRARFPCGSAASATSWTTTWRRRPWAAPPSPAFIAALSTGRS